MKHDRYRIIAAAFTVVLGVIGASCGGSATQAEETGGEKREPIHLAAAINKATFETNKAYVEEDLPAALRGLQALRASTRELTREDEKNFSSEIVNYDMSFHIVIERSIVYAENDRADDAFNQFVWVERHCVGCHRLARDAGLDAPGGSR